MNSCIYEGRVRHTRLKPARHRFSYKLFMMYLDLDEIPALFKGRWFWSTRRPTLARFRRSDHLGPDNRELRECVCDLVEEQTGDRPTGPIRLLTNLSYFGFCFNPVSFYYCFSDDGAEVQYIVAEVNNTPWGERDTYVMRCDSAEEHDSGWRFRPAKKMHVSPFMSMDVEYDWVLSAPSDRLNVYMANSVDGERFFDAGLALRRKDISAAALAGVLIRFPLMTLKVISAIYWEALRLWSKGCQVYNHPDKKKEVLAQ